MLKKQYFLLKSTLYIFLHYLKKKKITFKLIQMNSDKTKKEKKEHLIITADLKLRPIEVTNNYIVLNGEVFKYKNNQIEKNIKLYFDYDLYLDILLDIKKYKRRKHLYFTTSTYNKFSNIQNDWYCNEGVIGAYSDKNENYTIIKELV